MANFHKNQEFSCLKWLYKKKHYELDNFNDNILTSSRGPIHDSLIDNIQSIIMLLNKSVSLFLIYKAQAFLNMLYVKYYHSIKCKSGLLPLKLILWYLNVWLGGSAIGGILWRRMASHWFYHQTWYWRHQTL